MQDLTVPRTLGNKGGVLGHGLEHMFVSSVFGVFGSHLSEIAVLRDHTTSTIVFYANPTKDLACWEQQLAIAIVKAKRTPRSATHTQVLLCFSLTHSNGGDGAT